MITRPAHGAGFLYASDADELVTEIVKNLMVYPIAKKVPSALVVPHGAIDQCGIVSAAAYRHISKHYPFISTIVILAAASEKAKGAVLPISDEFCTPLGNVPVAQRYIQSLSLFPFVHRCEREHKESLAIEVQLPYLQTCLNDFQVLPILVGEMSELDRNLLFNSLPFDKKTLTILSVDCDAKSGRCINKKEQALFDSYQIFLQDENRVLEKTDCFVAAEQAGSSPIHYQSFVAH